MADAAPTLAPSDANTDALVQSLMAKFGTPPASPNLIPFQQAKDRIRAQQEKLTPPPEPTLQPVPQNVPPPQITDPIKAMSPAMLALAGLAGAVSGGMTGAAQNLAGFVSGLKSGDAVATKDHLDEFNTKLDAALKANSTAIDQYKLAFQKYGADSDKLKDELASISDSENDAVLKHTLDMGDFNGAWKIIEGRQKQQELIQNRQEALNLRIDAQWNHNGTVALKDGTYVDAQYNPLLKAYRRSDGESIDPAQVSGFFQGVPAEALVTPDAAQQAAQMAVDAGDYKDAIALSGGFGNVGNMNRGIIRNAIGAYAKDKGMTGAQQAGKIAQFDSMVQAARVLGRIVGSTAQGVEELSQIAPLVKQTSDRIDRTRFPNVNSVELAAERGTGGEDVVQLASYIQSLRNAYVQVMSRGGRLTDTQRKYASELIDGTLAVNQIDAALKAIMTEGAVAQTSAARALQDVTGQKVTAPIAPQVPQAPAGEPDWFK